MDPEQFWRLTPREIARVLDGRARAARSRHDLIMQAAWTVAALGRSKKFPPLKNFLTTPTAPPKRSSWTSMYAAAASWAAASGVIAV